MLIRPSVPRAKLGELIAALPPCLIGMEACSGAHYWAGLFITHGQHDKSVWVNQVSQGNSQLLY
jgi:purine nucleoside permease